MAMMLTDPKTIEAADERRKQARLQLRIDLANARAAGVERWEMLSEIDLLVPDLSAR